MMFDEETVLKIMALGFSVTIPDHHLKYLLKKLYGLDGLSLDIYNTQFLERIEVIVNELKGGEKK